LIIHLGERVQFLQQFLLAFVQLGWNLDSHFNVKIALPASVHYRHPFVANAECGVRLRAFGNLQSVLAFHGGYSDLSSHRSLGN